MTSGGHTYLEGFCERAQAIRTFRVDRIITALLGEPMPTSIGMQTPISQETRAVVTLAGSARWALDTYPFANIQDGAAGTIEAELAFRDPHWLVQVVLSMGGSLTVQSPREARKWVADAAAAAYTSYS